MTQPAPTPTPPTPGDPASAPIDPTPSTDPAPTPGDPAAEAGDLGNEGQKAIQIQRQRARAAEALIAEMAGMSKTQVKAMLDKALDVEQKKTELELLNERLSQHESELKSERTARWRAEVAQGKGLTAEQAAWLTGDTREEYEAAADRLLSAFPAAPTGPRTPAPDPSQGARGGGTGAGDLDSQIAEAQKNRDVNRVIALQRQKLTNVKR